ncbi:MAG: AraC family transcriptional regulator [Lachnospiraceae bacterium]|jgi:AraC-like DNA-binding protein|nr:AraC family transcriptional regulator [Lachnospiraceae bacterium]MCI1328202.1 AraC family transcriptional regulator [Lachnospiraceae bacterium]
MDQSKKSWREIFHDLSYPRLLYANRQDYGDTKHERPMHGHESLCELLLCYHGTGIYNVNDDSYEVNEGDLIYYNVGERHEVLSKTDTEIGTYCYGFSSVKLPGLRENALIPADSPHVRPSGSRFAILKELSEWILDLDASDPVQSSLMQSLGTSILLTAVLIPATAVQSRTTSAAMELTKRVKDYINAHYTEDIRLDDIAEALSFSIPYISHTFKSVTGYSPVQYLIRCRIGLAETLLISSDLPVTQIAMTVGYDNTNHFQTLFKNLVGTTPLQYRKKYLSALHGQRDQL